MNLQKEKYNVENLLETTERHEKVKEQRSTIKEENEKYVVECPFDGEKFTGENLAKVIHREGAYRSRKFVQKGHIPHESDLEKDETLVDEWNRSQDQKFVFDNLPEGKFRTLFVVNKHLSKVDKFKVEQRT